jgi:hypothetical protein
MRSALSALQCVESQLLLEELACGKIADEATIGGEEVVFRQFLELHPFELLEDLVLEFALERGNGEEPQVNGSAMAVVVPDMGDMLSDRRADAEFFLQLAQKRLLRGFAWFDFASGELPLQRHGLIGPPLTDQDPAVPNQQPGHNKTERRADRARVGNGLRLFHTPSVTGRKDLRCDGERP